MMDSKKVGNLIRQLRRERNMTQKELADAMNLSDKTISKWERGMGCPDVSLFRGLSAIFGVSVEALLTGEMEASENDGGNMKRIKFYVCPDCGNVLTATGEAEITCCGRKLEALKPQKADEAHRLELSEIEDETLITSSHEMDKSHYISFVAYANWERVVLVKLYPEQSIQVRMPHMRGGLLYYYCSRHGLFYR